MFIGHEKQWKFLLDKFESGKLSHAYFFSGGDGIGKKLFAFEFAKFISCKLSKKKPCGDCINCQMIEKNCFPDLMVVKPDGAEIHISKIKEIQNFLSYKPYYGVMKIVVVDEADKMNQEAQSCFLKTLEEPRGSVLIILISSKPDLLLSTIASRCQNVKFLKPRNLVRDSSEIEKEREILRNFLLVANSDLADKFKYAKALNFEKEKATDILRIVQKYLRYLLFCTTGIKKTKEQEEMFCNLPETKRYNILQIKSKAELADELFNKLTFTNVNQKLAIEILLMEF